MQLITKMIVMTKDIGIHGNLFGGILMSWIDEAGGSFATEFCRTPQMVTLKVGELLFKKPLRPGNHVRIYGEVEHLGTTSLTINIEARRLNLYNGEETVVCTTSITYVRIDEEGSAIPISQAVRNEYLNEISNKSTK
ncbi:MAG: hotdog domain-containing protein [Brumimicrobium sp.]